MEGIPLAQFPANVPTTLALHRHPDLSQANEPPRLLGVLIHKRGLAEVAQVAAA